MAFIVSSSPSITTFRRRVTTPPHLCNTPPRPAPAVSRHPARMVLSTREKNARLRQLLCQTDTLHLMPCCYDGLSAKLVQRAGFDLTFLSGFATAGAHGLPDTGLLNATDMQHVIQHSTAVIDIPLIADGDTGFGNSVNVFRTVSAYARAGASGVLIEDQVNPKRYVIPVPIPSADINVTSCTHTRFFCPH